MPKNIDCLIISYNFVQKMVGALLSSSGCTQEAVCRQWRYAGAGRQLRRHAAFMCHALHSLLFQAHADVSTKSTATHHCAVLCNECCGSGCMCAQDLVKQFRVLICDECHFIKDPSAQRTKATVPLVKEARRAILLSGTPALNKPKELFQQVGADSHFVNWTGKDGQMAGAWPCCCF